MDRVYFLWKKTSGHEGRWREYNSITDQWVNTPQQAYYLNLTSEDFSDPMGFAVDDSYIYIYYAYNDYPNLEVYSLHNKRLKMNNQLMQTSLAQKIYEIRYQYSTTTVDNISHLAYYYYEWGDGLVAGIVRNRHTGSGLFSEMAYNYNYGSDPPDLVNISSSLNDVHIIWRGNNSNNLFYIYDDQVPLAPQNLGAVATSDYHPKLLWTNTNADAKKYFIYRSTYNGGYTTPIAAVDHNSSLSSQFFIDYTITVPRPGGQAGAKYYYVVKTEDWGQNMSGFSNSVEVTSSNLYWEKKLSDNTESVSEYVLEQNYPNPFNPSTKISFSIKEEGFVTLKVYDVLGKEVAILVNENKPAGNYSVDFDASQLPSGMYIYKLQAGGFSDVKKMLLTK